MSKPQGIKRGYISDLFIRLGVTFWRNNFKLLDAEGLIPFATRGWCVVNSGSPINFYALVCLCCPMLMAPPLTPPLPRCLLASRFYALLSFSPNEQVQKALSMASYDEAPFGSLRLCVEGFGESRALRMLDDYLSMGEVEFARCCFFLPELPCVGYSLAFLMTMSSYRYRAS